MQSLKSLWLKENQQENQTVTTSGKNPTKKR